MKATASIWEAMSTGLRDERGDGAQFTNCGTSASSLVTPIDLACKRYGIEHRLTKVNHPWTNGQVERMNRTLKEELRKDLAHFLLACNFGKRLNALKGQTSHERMCSEFEQTPNSFKCNPCHHTAGPYNY